ncbi:hypothetical protein ACFVVU_24260 [Kitasatospora sp. NPDC057965]|uniref:hypothetical protein n=1 Tax=Kitasatospora sp. NPDC057965 TaxID=3346291 RepID=UPI0036DCBA2D
MTDFLIGAAFTTLLALALTTVITGVITALKVGPPPPPITRQAHHFSPETNPDNRRRAP